jgi:15-cis-phytoene synthase
MITDLVREHDRDRYLATLYAPSDKRPQLLALYAFAAELSRIPRLVSEAQIGEIRLQWWAETLETIERGGAVDHPVAAGLAKLKLPFAPLKAMVEARRFDLYADKLPSLSALEGYLGETEAGVFQLAAMILSPEDARGAADLSGLTGVAFGMAKVLAAGNPGLIPEGETQESLTAHALKRLAEARALSLPQAVLPAYLPAALTENCLSGPPGLLTPLKRQFLIWRAARREAI